MTNALPIRPMNSSAITYPLKRLADLSEDARRVHRHFNSGAARVERDIFDRESRYSVPKKDFTPTDRMLAAFAELDAAGLGHHDATYGWFHTTKVHPLYTWARGRGANLVLISTFEHSPRDGHLLAALVGADIESREARQGLQELIVQARHDDATDVEHDASSTALLTIRNPGPPEYGRYGQFSFTGVLTEAKLYDIGVDPTAVDDADSRPGEMCTNCEKSHPYAPYTPPQVPELSRPTFVSVHVWTIRPYLVQDPDQPIDRTNTDEDDE